MGVPIHSGCVSRISMYIAVSLSFLLIFLKSSIWVSGFKHTLSLIRKFFGSVLTLSCPFHDFSFSTFGFISKNLWAPLFCECALKDYVKSCMYTWKNDSSSWKNIRQTIEEKIKLGNIYELNQRDDGIAWKFEFWMYMNLTTVLALKNPVLNFLNFLSSRALLFYKPLSYWRKRVIWLCLLWFIPNK